ncbi:MAG: hypothetical protein WAL90_17860 [Desulfobacterales bacterium]
MNRQKVLIMMLVAFMLFCFNGGGFAAVSAASKNTILLSAASPFEDLTEYALAANWDGMNRALKAYFEQAVEVRKVLSAKAREDLAASIAAIEKSVGRRDNETVALKSVEAYRILIDALDKNLLVVPVQVALLDYAGFVSTVLSHFQSATDWPALEKAAAEAARNWAAIRDRVADKGLRDAVDTAIAGLHKAAIDKNLAMAIFAAQIDLALVDLLEGYFEPVSK